MTLHRYTPLRASKGTTWPASVRRVIEERDGECVGPRIGMLGSCAGPLDPDHVRASGALGRKSRSTVDNGVLLCRWVHHRIKTDHGRTWRPLLLAWIAAHPRPEPDEGHAHVDPHPLCALCDELAVLRRHGA